MSIAKQIIATAAAASIAAGASAAEPKQLAPFVKPRPQEAVLFDRPFNSALKAMIAALDAKQQPSDRVNNEVITAAYNSIRKQQGKAPGKDQQVMLFDYIISSAVIIDAEKKTIAVFNATEDATTGKVTITNKKPVLVYAAEAEMKADAVAAQAIAALDKINEIMAARGNALPNLGNALQPGGVDTKKPKAAGTGKGR